MAADPFYHLRVAILTFGIVVVRGMQVADQ
jgi:hypothetical protein